MGLDIAGFGSIADLVKGVIDKIWPDKTQQEKDQMAQAMLLIQSQVDLNKGQLEINKVEAASGSLFVSGWRPFVGWVCGAACAWNWIGLPVAKFSAALIGHPLTFAPADLSEMMPLLMGLLGMGALRSYEKVAGVARK